MLKILSMSETEQIQSENPVLTMACRLLAKLNQQEEMYMEWSRQLGKTVDYVQTNTVGISAIVAGVRANAKAIDITNGTINDTKEGLLKRNTQLAQKVDELIGEKTKLMNQGTQHIMEIAKIQAQNEDLMSRSGQLSTKIQEMDKIRQSHAQNLAIQMNRASRVQRLYREREIKRIKKAKQQKRRANELVVQTKVLKANLAKALDRGTMLEIQLAEIKRRMTTDNLVKFEITAPMN